MNVKTISWPRLALGINLIGFGVFALLTTQGSLPWSFWLAAAPLWPVLLVAAGLRLIFERSAIPWAVLASPLLIQGTLAYAATHEPPAFDGPWVELHAERSLAAERWTLDAELALARLDVETRLLPEGVLTQGRAAVRGGRPQLSLREQAGDPPRVRWRHGGSDFHTLGQERQRWEMGVGRELPVAVDLDLAFVRGRVDLDGAPVEKFRLDGAFNDVVLVLGVPAQDTRVDLEGAFNNFDLQVPEGTPVRVRSDGALLVVDGRRAASDLEAPAYLLRVAGFCSRVTVRSTAPTRAAR